MTAKLKSLRDYTDCIRAESKLLEISKQLEEFSEWYSQFYFEEKDYENFIDEARNLIEEFAKGFNKLASEEIVKPKELTEQKVKQIKAMEKRVMEELTEPEKFLE